MGQQRVALDTDTMVDLMEMGMTQKESAKELGISPMTLSKRIADIQEKQQILLQYRKLQSLQLTELQARVLEAITPEKINEAPLRDLVVAFKILKDKELVMEDKGGTNIKGLIAYLIELEKEEGALALPVPAVDAEFEEVKTKGPGDITDSDYVPEV